MEISDQLIKNRYLTLEKNVKSKSNSFYDSFLDLLECTIKVILLENNIAFDKSRTCGAIVKEPQVIMFFRSVIGVNENVYGKISDYVKKVNDHKHKSEKNLQIESLLRFMSFYCKFYNFYARHKGIPELPFYENYFKGIYGETERVNAELRSQVFSLEASLNESIQANEISKEDANLYKERFAENNTEAMSLDEHNQLLRKQLETLNIILGKRLATHETQLASHENRLNDIEAKLEEGLKHINNYSRVSKTEVAQDRRAVVINFLQNSTKTIEYIDQKKFKKNKMLVILLGIVTVAMFIVFQITRSILFSNYSIYSLFELLGGLIVFITVFKVAFMPFSMPYDELVNKKVVNYFYDNEHLPTTTLLLFKRYKVFMWIGVIGCVLDIIDLFAILNIANFSLKWLFVILAIMLIVAFILFRMFISSFGSNYIFLTFKKDGITLKGDIFSKRIQIVK